MWGGESRAEGGFDCSGLIDYALAAAGFPVGRPTAAGLQALTEPVPLGRGPRRRPRLRRRPGPPRRAGRAPGPRDRGAAPRSLRALRAAARREAGRRRAVSTRSRERRRRARRFPAGSPTRCAPSWSRRVSRRTFRRRCSPRRSRPRAGSTRRSVSRSGALGLAQFMPGTWSGSWNPWRARSPLDPAAAIHAQARYLRGLVDRADGDLARALAAYHDGWDGSAGRPWPPVTRAYVSTILRRFGGSVVRPALGDAASMRAAPPARAVLRLVSLGSGEAKGVISRSLDSRLPPSRVDMPPQGSFPCRATDARALFDSRRGSSLDAHRSRSAIRPTSAPPGRVRCGRGRVPARRRALRAPTARAQRPEDLVLRVADVHADDASRSADAARPRVAAGRPDRRAGLGRRERAAHERLARRDLTETEVEPRVEVVEPEVEA